MTKKQKMVLTLATVAIISLFFLIIMSDNGLVDLNTFKKQHEALVKENEKIQREITSLSTEIDRAKNDPVYIEAVARQELGMIGKDEVLLKFDGDTK